MNGEEPKSENLGGEAAATQPDRAGPSRPLVIGVCLIAAVLAAIPRVAGLLAVPDPWVDEAMLVWNFLAGSATGLFKPLPYYEQATSLGHLLVGRLAVSASPDHFVLVLRSFSAAASLGAAILLFRLFRKGRSTLVAALATALVLLAPTVIFQSVEIKSYVLDLLGAAAILLTGANAHLRGATPRSLAVFVLASLAAMIISNPAVLVIAGVGLAMALLALVSRPLDLRRIIRIAVAGAVIGAGGALLYLVYTRNVITIQLAAYGEDYKLGLAVPFAHGGWISSWVTFARLLRAPFLYEAGGGLLSPGFWFYGLALIGLVCALAGRNAANRFIAVAGVLILAATAVAAIAGVYQPETDRLILFTVPVSAFLVVGGMDALASLASGIAPRRIRPDVAGVLLAAAVLGYGVYQVARETDQDREPMRPALAHLAAAGDWPGKTWVYYASEPVVDVLTYPRLLPYLGRVSNRSVATGWIHEPRTHWDAYLARFRAAIAGRDEIYILMSHFRAAHSDEAMALETAAQALVGPCRVAVVTEGNRGAAELVRCAKGLQPGAPGEHLHRLR